MRVLLSTIGSRGDVQPLVMKQSIQSNPSRFCSNGRDQGFDVTECESEPLVTVRITGDLRNMIRHHHAVEADLLVYAHRLQHIDIAVVDECLLEIQEASADIPEMDVEDLFPASEIPNHIEDLLAGFLQHFRDSALAEIQSVIRTLFDRDEPLETFNRAQHGLDASEAAA